MKAVFLWLCWLALAYSPVLQAQSGPRSGGQQEKRKARAADVARVDSLNELSFNAKGALARQHALEAQALALDIGYRKGLADSYLRLGRVDAQEEHWPESEAYYRKALAEREKLGNLPDIASCYNQLGNLRKAQGDYEGAATYFEQGLAIMHNQPLHLNTITLHSNLGYIYRILGKYEQARQHLETASRMHDPLCNSSPEVKPAALAFSLASVRMNLAEFLQSARHQYPAAADSLQKSLEAFQALGKKAYAGKCLLLLGDNAYFRGKLEEAGTYYEKGIAVGDQLVPDDLYTLYRNRGRIYLEQGQNRQALAHFRHSLAAFVRQQDRQHTAAVQFEIGNFYYETENLDSAVQYYQLALANNIRDLKLQGRLLYFLSDALYNAGRMEESQRYTGEYIQLLDRLNEDQTRGAFKELTQHMMDKNRLLKRIVQQEKQTQKLYGLIAIGSLLLLALLALLVVRRFAARDTQIARQQEKLARNDAELARKNEEQAQKDKELAQKKAELARQNEQIVIQEKLELLKNKELETNYAKQAGQEEMQKKIGQELHDGVGAMLSTVKLQLATVDEVLDKLPVKKRQQYARANQTLDEACVEVRRIAYELTSAVLTKFGLKPQLEALSDAIAISGKLKPELFTHGLKERLDNTTENHIYRMVQELVQNVVKHARASHISIQVNRFEDTVNVIVEDDGVGFDAETIRHHSGSGMQNLAARVHELDGQLLIDSRPGRGTTVSIDIPLKVNPYEKN